MEQMGTKSAIAFFIFNRPDKTARVFEKIRQARPKKLFVIADGPRPHKQGEAELCKQTREQIQVDWDCELKTHFSDVNMGCKDRISSGITWVFTQVEEAILIEDDVMMDESFFTYCDELLEKYRNDARVGMIAGVNIFQKPFTNDSYFFSNEGGIWGWATWKRAWNLYDVKIPYWKEYSESEDFKKLPLPENEREIRKKQWDAVAFEDFDTWDYQWTLTLLKNHMLSVIPNTNLIYNIGFDKSGTHTVNPEDECAFLTAEKMSFPMNHPDKVRANSEYDHKFCDHFIDRRFALRVQYKIKKILRKLRQSNYQ